MKRFGKSELITHRLSSKILAGNPLGDPTERDLLVYLPPITESLEGMPTLLALAGFGGTGKSLFNFDPFSETLQARMDRLILSGACEPAIIVAPDCFTRLGGNQYINSSAIGNYEDYLVKEVVPFVNRTHAAGPWGVFGKSSGGYGSMILAMNHPELFRVFATHSGDSGFELCYLPDFREALDIFRKFGGPKNWFAHYGKDENKQRKSHLAPLLVLAMAASYSPDPASAEMGISFPFHLETGSFLPSVWQRWREFDPVNRVKSQAENLKKLDFIYVDCGSGDEHSLHWGARAFVKALREEGVSFHYEEFEDGHRSLSYRYDQSLPLLCARLTALK